jgi:hypothetical protein
MTNYVSSIKTLNLQASTSENAIGMLDLATIPAINSNKIQDLTITNDDISLNAAIELAKLADTVDSTGAVVTFPLFVSAVNTAITTLSTSIGTVDTRLITNANVSGTAGIELTKLASTTNRAGTVVSIPDYITGVNTALNSALDPIIDADISATAAITLTKLANTTDRLGNSVSIPTYISSINSAINNIDNQISLATTSDATPTLPGRVSTGVQSFGGKKTFVDVLEIDETYGAVRYFPGNGLKLKPYFQVKMSDNVETSVGGDRYYKYAIAQNPTLSSTLYKSFAFVIQNLAIGDNTSFYADITLLGKASTSTITGNSPQYTTESGSNKLLLTCTGTSLLTTILGETVGTAPTITTKNIDNTFIVLVSGVKWARALIDFFPVDEKWQVWSMDLLSTDDADTVYTNLATYSLTVPTNIVNARVAVSSARSALDTATTTYNSTNSTYSSLVNGAPYDQLDVLNGIAIEADHDLSTVVEQVDILNAKQETDSAAKANAQVDLNTAIAELATAQTLFDAEVAALAPLASAVTAAENVVSTAQTNLSNAQSTVTTRYQNVVSLQSQTAGLVITRDQTYTAWTNAVNQGGYTTQEIYSLVYAKDNAQYAYDANIDAINTALGLQSAAEQARDSAQTALNTANASLTTARNAYAAAEGPKVTAEEFLTNASGDKDAAQAIFDAADATLTATVAALAQANADALTAGNTVVTTRNAYDAFNASLTQTQQNAYSTAFSARGPAKVAYDSAVTTYNTARQALSVL